MFIVRSAMVTFVFCLSSLACSNSDETGDGHEHETGDGGTHGEGGARAEADKCCELGAVCHVTGDDVDPEVQACHELGHENNAVACAAEYEFCLELCQGVNDSPVEHACQ